MPFLLPFALCGAVLFRMYDSEGSGVLSAADVGALLDFIAERIVHWTGADSVWPLWAYICTAHEHLRALIRKAN